MHVIGSGLGGEWVRGLCLGFTNPVGTAGVWVVLGGVAWAREGGVMSVFVVSLDSLYVICMLF